MKKENCLIIGGAGYINRIIRSNKFLFLKLFMIIFRKNFNL